MHEDYVALSSPLRDLRSYGSGWEDAWGLRSPWSKVRYYLQRVYQGHVFTNDWSEMVYLGCRQQCDGRHFVTGSANCVVVFSRVPCFRPPLSTTYVTKGSGQDDYTLWTWYLKSHYRGYFSFCSVRLLGRTYFLMYSQGNINIRFHVCIKGRKGFAMYSTESLMGWTSEGRYLH